LAQEEQLELFSRIEGLPWQALHDEAIHSGIPDAEIKEASKEQILNKLIESGFTNERLKDLINKYAYGKVVSIILWHMEGEYTEEDLQEIKQLLDDEYQLENKNFRNLKFTSVTVQSNRIELIYTYSKRHNYIDEAGIEKIVWEQHIGCVWIGTNQQYIAVLGKDEKVWTKVANLVATKVHRKHTPIRPPKTAIDRCFLDATPSRVTLVSPGGERTTISRTEGFTPEQQDETNRISENRRKVSGSYKTAIGDNKNVTARYNSTKGNITILKFLPVEVLFDWTQTAVSIILEEITNLRGKAANEIFSAFGKEIVWAGIPIDKHEHMEWFLSRLLSASQTEITEIAVSQELVLFLEDSRYFVAAYRPHCAVCDSPVGAICGECGVSLSVDNVRELKCPSGHPLFEGTEYRLICPEHHRLPILKPEHCWYLPTAEVVKKIDDNIQKIYPGSGLAKSWYIANMQLIIHPERMQAREIPFEDIDCFQIVSGAVTNEKKTWLVSLKEKCSSCSNINCNSCIPAISSICLMRIFNPVIPGFRPQPHRGGEYGDISGQVQYNGRILEMKGIIKSNTKNGATSETKINTPLLSTTTAGGEIIRQIVEQGLTDARCNLIAIIAPQYIDAGLKGNLRFLCALGQRNITFIELDQLCHIAAAFKESFGEVNVPDLISRIP